MLEKDLADYKVIVAKALQGTYLGRKVYTTHPPASGAVLINMLNILEHYPLPKEGLTPLNFHRMVESLKCTFFRTILFVNGTDPCWQSGSRPGKTLSSKSLEFECPRTRIGDPAFMNDTFLQDQVPTKAFGNHDESLLTDVSSVQLIEFRS